MKECKKCGLSKPESEFYKIRGNPTSPCKQCVIARTTAYYKENRSRANVWRYWNRVRREYGIEQVEAEAIFKKQNGRCAICRRPLLTFPTKDTHIDHCHKTNKVRGILCNSCNGGLGKFKDSKKLLIRAIRYLDAG